MRDFDQHLHNGDPLSARTVRRPAGRPESGHALFAWTYSATDALASDHFTTWTDWSLAGTLYKLESYNGFGPRMNHGRATGYLWAQTTAYAGGKYVADGVWSATAQDVESGCAAVLKVLMEHDAVSLGA